MIRAETLIPTDSRPGFIFGLAVECQHRTTDAMISPTINVNGTITPAEEARIPVLDRGFLYGDSVYEVFRTYQNVPLFLEDHFERLENSARLIHMRIDQSRNELMSAIRSTARAAGVSAEHPAYVRYQITRGDGQIDLYPEDGLTSRFVVIVKALPDWKAHLYQHGVDMLVTAVRRNASDALDPNIKGGNYLNNILGLTEARQRGADDCVMLDAGGWVTEAANSNVWFVLNDELVTPASGNLRGLTKKHVHIALKEAGLKSAEKDIHVSDLFGATECFVTSATREVMPCASLGLPSGQTLRFSEGGGEWTRLTMKTFSAYIDRYIQAHQADAIV